MKQIRTCIVLRAICLGILISAIPVYAELLVIKKGKHGFVPLDESDEKNKSLIAHILLKYEWPMVIANSDLTKQEEDELLSPKPYAEEKFIRRKLQAINPNYDVVFIPTSIYELFAVTSDQVPNSPLTNAYKESSSRWIDIADLSPVDKKSLLDAALPLTPDGPFDQARFDEFEHELSKKNEGIVYLSFPEANHLIFKINPDLANKIHFPFITSGDIDLLDILNNSNKPADEIYREIYGKFRFFNRFFYRSAFFEINNALGAVLFKFDDGLGSINDSSVLSQRVEAISSLFAAFVVNVIKVVKKAPVFKEGPGFELKKNETNPTELHPLGLLAQAIKLEYKARSENKGLLFRGTAPISFNITANKQLQLMGSTLKGTWLSTDIARDYKTSSYQPFSISFGNSLFIGYFNDWGACPYMYLAKHGGYALMVNKKQYISHGTPWNLFYISPLAPLAALYARGEFFHSRTKGGTPDGCKKSHSGCFSRSECFDF